MPRTSVKVMLAAAVIGGAFLLVHNGGSRAAPACPKSPTATLEDFPPYEYELRSSHEAELDSIADDIVSTMKKKSVTKIRIVGHAAKYGSSDFAKTARFRATVVEAELQSRLADRGVDYTGITFDTSGMSTDCPVATNDTKAGRAKNRRVEVWVTSKAKAKPKKPKKPKKKTVEELLKSLDASTSNPTTECMIEKLGDKHGDHSYVSDSDIAEYMKPDISTARKAGLTTTELVPLLEKAVDRINSGKGTGTAESRFKKTFERRRSDIIRGINDAIDGNCYDARIPEIRRYLLRKAKDDSSFYSCPVLKKQLEDGLEKIGGTRGCST